MNHWLVAPILLPLFTGLGLLLVPEMRTATARCLSILSAVLQLLAAALLLDSLREAQIQVYAIGDWMPPYGIVLVLDHLSALMVGLTAVLGLACIGFAASREQSSGSQHSLMHFLLMGVNGAFLTGDLFNLFVFFEVLLLASYALLVHGGGPDRTRAGFHYVVLNLTGSALFLISVATLYGVTGTLNMAHLAERVGALGTDDQPLVGAAAAVLLVVFGLKAGLVPLYFWLPKAYANTDAAVAALFAIMTKVGIYAIARVYPLIFGDAAGNLAHFAAAWLWPLGLLTIALGLIGVLAARALNLLIAYLLVISIGTLIAGMALNSEAAYAATVFYLLQSTLVTGGLFLLSGLLAGQRRDLADKLQPGPALARPNLLAGLFLLAAVSVIGLPPLAGFVGKVLLLQAAADAVRGGWLWVLLLTSSLAGLIALSRAGTTVFFKTDTTLERGRGPGVLPLAWVAALLLAGPVLVAAGNPLLAFNKQLAAQLMTPDRYIEAVNAEAARMQREHPPTPSEQH